MKVKITYQETLSYQLEKEVELTRAEITEYNKNGNLPTQLYHDITSECCDEHFTGKESEYISITKLEGRNKGEII